MRKCLSIFLIVTLALNVVAMDVIEESSSDADQARSKVDQRFLDNALWAAVDAEQRREVKRQLKAGANVNARCNNKTALERAIYGKNETIIKLLLEHKANANDGLSLVANFQTKFHLKLASLLVDHGAKPTGHQLGLAISRDHVKMTKLLIDKGGSHDEVVGSAHNSYRPFFFAYFGVTLDYFNVEHVCQKAHSPLQAYLESLGVDRNLECYHGKTLDQWAEITKPCEQ